MFETQSIFTFLYMKQEELTELINKINSEDNLLNSRVNIFLVLQGLLLTAFAFEKSQKGEIVFVPLEFL